METPDKNTIDQYFRARSQKATADWDHLPDIGLYMDQVITYLERQLEIFMTPGSEKLITPSMINNYAKAKIVPRTEGKKYNQEHIALLLSVFTLKRVLSVQDMGALLDSIGCTGDVKEFYERFRQSMEHSSRNTAALISSALEADGLDEKALRSIALELAVDASMRSFAAETLLAFANPEKGEADREGAVSKAKDRAMRKQLKKKASA
jgi:hypothetical protein